MKTCYHEKRKFMPMRIETCHCFLKSRSSGRLRTSLCISSRFRVLHLLSWEFERSEVLRRYTVILACHLKHVKSADLHETILTPVICHYHIRYHDGVTLYFSLKFLSVAPKKTRNWYFSYMSADFRAL